MSAVLKIAGISPDTGTSSSDGITDTSHINVLGSGAVANSVVTVFDGVTALGTTTADGSGVWTFNYTASTLSDGAHNLTANDGVNTSGIFTATIDTSTPAPTLDTITTDSGKSATDFITSAHTLVLNGTAEAGAEVDAFINGVSKAFATADASGNYSIDLGSQAVSLADGTYSVQILATDVAGNSHFSSVSSVTIDSTAAAAPTVDSIVTDSGRSSSDGVTNQMNFDLHGTAVAGDEVDVYADGGFVASVTADGSGNWTYSASQGGNTTATWTAKDVDTAGNVSSASSGFVVNVDVSAPAAPGAPDLADASDTGRSSSDDITNDLTPTVGGVAEGNAIVHVFDGASEIGTALADGSGNWSFTPASSIGAGSHTITATATDTAGNTGSASSGLSITIDTSAPAFPTLSLDPASDSGATGDGITNDTTPTFDGKAEANAIIQFTVDDVSFSGGVLGTVLADASGNYTFTLPTALADGNHSVSARAVDTAGNIGTPDSFGILIDATAPTLAINAIATDDRINIAEAAAGGTISGTTNAEDGQTVTVEIFDHLNTLVYTDTAAVSSGSWSINVSNTTLQSLADGSYTAKADVSDVAGNPATEASRGFTVDETAPVAPTSLDLVNASDSGRSQTDDVTNDATPTVSGTAEANAVIDVYDGVTHLGSVLADASGNWTFTSTTLSDTSHSITATATDAAGNTGPASSILSITVDTTNPLAPSTPDMTAGTDSGSSATDNDTSNTTPTFTGTSEGDAIVHVFDGATEIGTALADGSGNWTFTPGSALSEGAHSISAKAEDIAGNTGPASSSLSVTIDTTAPVAATVTGIADDTHPSFVGTATDGITSDTTLHILGTAEANSTVHVFQDNVEVGTVAADGSGNFDFNYTGTSLAEGGYDFTAKAEDAAGNVGSAASAFHVVVDTTAPSPTISSTFTDDSGASGDGLTNDKTLTFHGTAEAGNEVDLYDQSGLLVHTVADASGNWTMTTGALSDGVHHVRVFADDLAGNFASSTTVDVTVDTVAPTAAVTAISTDTGSSATDGDTRDRTLVISGTTSEGGSTVEVFQDGTSIGTVTADASGNWSLDHTGTILSDGTYQYTAQATDAAANTGVASSNFTVVVDNVAPNPAAATQISDDTGSSPTDHITNDNTVHIFGTAEAGATVQVFVDGVSQGTTVASGSGTWSFDDTGQTLSDGVHSVTTRVSDLAGNSALNNTPFNFTVDTTAPTATVAVSAIADDTGTSGSDFLTNDTTLTLTGTNSALGSGETVQVSSDGGVNWSDATQTDATHWKFIDPTTHNSTFTYDVQIVDTAGNVDANTATQSVQIDTTAPAASAVTGITTDTGTSGTDGVTSDTSLTINGTGEAFSVATIYKDGVQIGTATTDNTGHWSFDYTGTPLSDGSYAFTATATDTAGNTNSQSPAFTVKVDTAQPNAPTIDLDATSDTGASSTDNVTSDNTPLLKGTAEAGSIVTIIDTTAVMTLGTVLADGSGNWSFTSGVLADGGHDIDATATDLAGNTSSASSILSVTVDTVAPTATVAIGAISTDSGASATDFITNDTTLTLTGTNSGLNPGDVIQVSSDGGDTWSNVSQDTGTTWSFVDPTTHNSSFTYSVRIVDTAGNVDTNTASQAVTIDTSSVAPALTSITTDTGKSSSDFITTDQTLVLAGTAEANSTVQVSVDNSTVGTTTADGSGHWSFDLTGTTLSEGQHTVAEVATDLAGNHTPSATQTVTVDETVAAPVVTGITKDTGTAGDGITSDQTLFFNGTAEANSTVEVFQDNVSLGTVTADASGHWSFDNTGTVLAVGTYEITAQATDLAGNVSADSAAFEVTIDLTGVTITGTSKNDTIDDTHAPAGQPFATDGNDIINALGGNDTINGLAGADTIDGGTGNDTIHGGDGNDVITGGAGNDHLFGDDGNDTFTVGGKDGQNDTFDGGTGTDVFHALNAVTLAGFNAGADSIETWNGDANAGITGTSANETFDLSHLTSVTNLAFVDGSGGNDIITGTDAWAGDLRGGAGNDTLTGGNNDDTLTGGAGNDTLHGGGGDDTLVVSGTGDQKDVLDGGTGTDTLKAVGAVTLNGFNATTDSIESWLGTDATKGLTGTSANETFDLSHLTSVNKLAFVDGGAGNDTITGTNAWNGDLRGNSGNDTLHGGTGDDKLTGGAGVDTFVFATGDGHDTIADLTFKSKTTVNAADDHVDLTSFGLADYNALHGLMVTNGANVDIHFTGGEILTITKTTIDILDHHQADFLLH